MCRFVRTAFYKMRMEILSTDFLDEKGVFYAFDSVKMLRSSVRTPKDKLDITIYFSCINTTKGIYIFKTYENT